MSSCRPALWLTLLEGAQAGSLWCQEPQPWKDKEGLSSLRSHLQGRLARMTSKGVPKSELTHCLGDPHLYSQMPWTDITRHQRKPDLGMVVRAGPGPASRRLLGPSMQGGDESAAGAFQLGWNGQVWA